MQQDFFNEKLYPLQDQALKIIAGCDTDFYLTGGTALSRFYLQHRYSDDLDLFVNYHPDFSSMTSKIAQALKSKYQTDEKISIYQKDFMRLALIENNVLLKMDFVNDIPYRIGDFVTNNFPVKIDSWQNILSNKLSALSRNAPKDYADLLFLAFKYSFNWNEMIRHAEEKDTWVNQLEISKQIYEFDIHDLNGINWINQVETDSFKTLFHTIAKDILNGSDNSIVKTTL